MVEVGLGAGEMKCPFYVRIWFKMCCCSLGNGFYCLCLIPLQQTNISLLVTSTSGRKFDFSPNNAVFFIEHMKGMLFFRDWIGANFERIIIWLFIAVNSKSRKQELHLAIGLYQARNFLSNHSLRKVQYVGKQLHLESKGITKNIN